MSKLDNLNELTRTFLQFELWGLNNILAEEKGNGEDMMPLIVVGNPPDSSFVIGSKMMTNFISQHTEDFEKLMGQIKATKDQRAQKEILNKMQNSMTDSVIKEFENPADIFRKTVELGREYLLAHADHAFYEHEPNKKRVIRFALTEDAKREMLSSGELPKDAQVLAINLLSQDDLMSVGTVILQGNSKRTPIAAIPVATDDKGGETSVPANEVGSFPVRLGQNPVANVSAKRDSD